MRDDVTSGASEYRTAAARTGRIGVLVAARLAFAAALVVAAAAVTTPGPARAHTTGISSSELIVDPRGDVRARFVFASADVAAVVRLDADGDGVLTAADVARAQRELGAFLRAGVEVTGDGERCSSEAALSSMDEADGLAFEGRYACGRGVRSVTATLFFLGELPRGHRHLAGIVYGDATTQRVLTATSRAITLTRSSVAETPSSGPDLRSVVGAIAVIMAALAALLWRLTRVTRTGVTSKAPDARRPPAVAESRRDP